MTNQSLVETVNAFIEDINACNSDAEIDALLASRDLRVHGLHTRYNSLQDVEKADKLIGEAAQNRRTVLAQGGEINEGDDLQEGDTVEVLSCQCGHGFKVGQRVTVIRIGRYPDMGSNYLCRGGLGEWWLIRKEFKKVN